MTEIDFIITCIHGFKFGECPICDCINKIGRNKCGNKVCE